MSDTHFSDYADFAAVERACGFRLVDKTIREHVQTDAFLNERDSFIERGIVYGYPLWTSIVCHKQNM